ncbi:MAG: hypothetical protein ACTS77_03610 [Arsenophonus sp. NC-TX2-MAG3]
MRKKIFGCCTKLLKSIIVKNREIYFNQKEIFSSAGFLHILSVDFLFAVVEDSGIGGDGQVISPSLINNSDRAYNNIIKIND